MVQQSQRFQTLDYVIALAREMIKGSNTQDTAWMREMAYWCLQELGYSDFDVHVSDRIYVEDFKIEKPCDYISGISLYIYDKDGGEYFYNYVNGGLVKDNEHWITVSEQDDYFSLSSNADKIHYAILKYYRLPQDDDGMPKFWAHQVPAVVAFLRYQWYLRENVRGQYSASIPYAEREWRKQKHIAKSANKMPSVLAAKSIANTWGSMIKNTHKKFRGIDGI